MAEEEDVSDVNSQSKSGQTRIEFAMFFFFAIGNRAIINKDTDGVDFLVSTCFHRVPFPLSQHNEYSTVGYQ